MMGFRTLPGGGLWRAVRIALKRETVVLVRAGTGRGKAAMRGWRVYRHLRKGSLTAGQREAVKLILSEKDRTVGVQGYVGTGKTRMLNRARARREEGLAHGRSRAVGLGGADPGGGIGHRERDLAALPRAERRRCTPTSQRRDRVWPPSRCSSASGRPIDRLAVQEPSAPLRGVRWTAPGSPPGLAGALMYVEKATIHAPVAKLEEVYHLANRA